MRVIVDTNILVSAVLKDRDPELVIQFIVDNPTFEWIASQAILTEYKEVLKCLQDMAFKDFSSYSRTTLLQRSKRLLDRG